MMRNQSIQIKNSNLKQTPITTKSYVRNWNENKYPLIKTILKKVLRNFGLPVVGNLGFVVYLIVTKELISQQIHY